MMGWLTPKRRDDIRTWVICAIAYTSWVVILFLISP